MAAVMALLVYGHSLPVYSTLALLLYSYHRYRYSRTKFWKFPYHKYTICYWNSFGLPVYPAPPFLSSLPSLLSSSSAPPLFSSPPSSLSSSSHPLLLLQSLPPRRRATSSFSTPYTPLVSCLSNVAWPPYCTHDICCTVCNCTCNRTLVLPSKWWGDTKWKLHSGNMTFE